MDLLDLSATGVLLFRADIRLLESPSVILIQ